MSKSKKGIKADISTIVDRRESVSQMEPLVLSSTSKYRTTLTDMSIELAAKSSGFKRSLPQTIVHSLADLVRSMNCYYSNLIEGHNTHPIEIERALKDDFSKDNSKRNLQLEAKAHIEVQRWIDSGALQGRVLTAAGICEVHKRFYENVPEELSWVENPETKKRIRVIPGEPRAHDVKVGNHVAISPGAVPRFLLQFEESYSALGKSELVLGAAAAHHRLSWIHPFSDGNGRVMRLLSHALLLETLDTGALWSVARGLARNSKDYKSHLANCDMQRRNDLDGRGALSEEALAKFTGFFLKTCLDQVSFMEKLMQPDQLRARILVWAEQEIKKGTLPEKSNSILDALLYRGEIPRGEIAKIVDTGERQGRRILSALSSLEVIRSKSSRAPIQLNFPAKLASAWMPGLFPEMPE